MIEDTYKMDKPGSIYLEGQFHWSKTSADSFWSCSALLGWCFDTNNECTGQYELYHLAVEYVHWKCNSDRPMDL